MFLCEGDDIGRMVDRLFWIIPVVGFHEREIGNPGLVCMTAHIPVGDHPRNPDGSLLILSFPDDLHDPCLIGIGNRKRLPARRITILLYQSSDHPDQLPGSF